MRRFILGGLLAFVALNAFGGGVYAMTGAGGVPTAWLRGSPFATYFVPGAILLVVVGGSAAIAAFATLADLRAGPVLARLASWILLVWIATQLAIIGFVSWLQPVIAVTGLVLLALAQGGPVRVRRAAGAA